MSNTESCHCIGRLDPAYTHKRDTRKMYISRTTIFLITVLCMINHFGLTLANKISASTMNKNQLHLEALQRSEGIYDRVVQKLQQKEEAQKKMVQEQVSEQLMMQ